MASARQTAKLIDIVAKRFLAENRAVIESLSLGGMAKIDFVDGDLVVTKIEADQIYRKPDELDA